MGAAGSIDLGADGSLESYKLSDKEIDLIYQQSLQVINTACGFIKDGESNLRVSVVCGFAGLRVCGFAGLRICGEVG